jgi:hypothetical protein
MLSGVPPYAGRRECSHCRNGSSDRGVLTRQYRQMGD